MPARFTDADTSPYAPGCLFLGYSDTGKEVGIASERHFICIAGSGSGKGSSLIVPNLKRWNDNVLVIDPGGGNARATWEAREAMGQTVHIIDPAHVSLKADKNHHGVPPHLLKSFNPLARLEPASRTYGEDIGVIADGMVMRHDPKHARWDNAGSVILAGLIDFVRTDPEFDGRRTLIEVRNLITQPPAALTGMFEAMAAPSRNRASKAAAALALADLKDTDGGSLIENAQQNTQWLDYTSISETLHESSFELSDLKTEPCTVFLVIHPDYMIEHGRFLRLFVRSALSVMAKGDDARQCLFILDEFFSLGKMDAVQKAAGGMRKNGVQLLPILQDFSQMEELYGPVGGKTFFANADAHIFFGNEQDTTALNIISNALGQYNLSDMPEFKDTTREANLIPSYNIPEIKEHNRNEIHREDRERQRSIGDFRHVLGSFMGKPRLPPDEVGRLIGKGPNDKVARSMIVFAAGGRVFNLLLAPYFRPPPAIIPPAPSFNLDFPAMSSPAPRPAPAKASTRYGKGLMIAAALGLLLSVALSPPLAPLALVLAVVGWGRNRHERHQLAGG